MKIGIALSGGGVKGAAHIGVLKALQEENIEISAISGTSSGSIVATLYACGYNPDEIFYIFKRYCKCITDYDKMIPFKIINTVFTGKIKLKSIAKGNNLEYIINQMCYKKNKSDIKEIDIPFAIPTVDIRNGEIVYFLNRKVSEKRRTKFDDNPSYVYNGKLSSIVRASASFPGVFEPKMINEFLLVDGGVRMNTPVTILNEIKENNEKIISVSFEKVDGNRVPQNIIDVSLKSFDIMGHHVNQNEIEKSDFDIEIESKGISLLDISKIDYMVNLGYNTTKKNLDKIKSVLE